MDSYRDLRPGYGIKGDAISRKLRILAVAGLALIGLSIAALLADPATPPQTRAITVGGATLRIPLHLPPAVVNQTATSGSALLGSKDDCDITYDRFVAIHWSKQPIPEEDLLPTSAYRVVRDASGTVLDFDQGRRTKVRDIHLAAEKPCGRVVEENLRVIELYCVETRIHYAVVGMLDPYVTTEKVQAIAGSLRCR